jgi:hypothetical protein
MTGKGFGNIYFTFSFSILLLGLSVYLFIQKKKVLSFGIFGGAIIFILVWAYIFWALRNGW